MDDFDPAAVGKCLEDAISCALKEGLKDLGFSSIAPSLDGIAASIDRHADAIESLAAAIEKASTK